MPNNGIDVLWDELGTLEAVENSISRNGQLYLEFTKDGIRIFYNDSSYRLPVL